MMIKLELDQIDHQRDHQIGRFAAQQSENQTTHILFRL